MSGGGQGRQAAGHAGCQGRPAREAQFAAQDHAAGVQDGGDGGRAQREAFGQDVEEGLAGRSGHRFLGRAVEAVPAGQGGDGLPAGQGVEAAAAVGRGGQGAGAGDGEEADLARPAGGTAAQPAVQDDGRADAPAQPEQDEGVEVAGGAEALLGEGGQVGLVLDEHGGGQAAPEGVHQVPVPDGQALGAAQFAAAGGDQAGGSDGDGVEVPGAGGAGGAQQGGHRVLGGSDGEGGFGQGMAEEVGDDGGDAVGAHVEGGEVGAVGDDPVQLGVGAAALFAGFSDDLDESGFGEAFDEVGDRGAGEAGPGLELGGRQRSRLLEELQGEAVVDGAGGAG